MSLGKELSQAHSCKTPLFSPGSENPPHRAIVKLLWASFEGLCARQPGKGWEVGGHRSKQLSHLFFGWDSDLQSARPRAETKPAEELRSWEKKQRALLR